MNIYEREHKDSEYLYHKNCTECRIIRSLMYGISYLNKIPEFPEIMNSIHSGVKFQYTQSVDEFFEMCKGGKHLLVSNRDKYTIITFPYSILAVTISICGRDLKWKNYHNCKVFKFMNDGSLIIKISGVLKISVNKKDTVRAVCRLIKSD